MAARAEPFLQRPRALDWVAMALIVAWGLWRLAPGLGHPGIWAWDESFHQVVTRHAHDQPFFPLLNDDPVHPLQNLREWTEVNIWLHKPMGPFWLGAAMMAFTGVSTAALRMGSLFGQLAAALAIYLFARALSNRAAALLAALAFLTLPFGWILTQGRFVGDVTDVTLSGAICLAVFCLFQSIEKDSLRWAAAAGAATGLGYLCKTVLSLTPVGMALVMCGLATVGFCQGPRLKAVGVMLLGFAAVAAPWNVYAAMKWPPNYWRVFQNTLGFISETSGEDVGSGIRPIDSVFNEINPHNYGPMGAALIVVLGVWLALWAWRTRSYIAVGLAVWLWATWVGHSIPAVKGHAHLWNSLVPGFVALALVLTDVWRSRALALAVAASLATPWAIGRWPALSQLREHLPQKLVHTRIIPGLVEGLVLVAAAVGVGLLLSRVRWTARWVPAVLLGLGAAAALAWLTLWKASDDQAHEKSVAHEEMYTSYTREVGLALDAHAPKPALLLFDLDMDTPNQFERLNLMFWSNRLARWGHDPADYPQAGFHPYLVSPAAESYAPVEGVPAHAWLRAYDLAVPLQGGPPLPAGVEPLNVAWGNMRVLGFAAGESDDTQDHYAFFVHADGVPGNLPVAFETRQATVSKVLPPEASLRHRQRLSNAPWFVVPTLGPKRRDLKALEFGPDTRVAVE